MNAGASSLPGVPNPNNLGPSSAMRGKAGAGFPELNRGGPASTTGAYFEIYRADRVRLTSVLFSGEDWRWRFCSSDGSVLASGGGFGTVSDCRAAVDALRAGAGAAILRAGT